MKNIYILVILAIILFSCEKEKQNSEQGVSNVIDNEVKECVLATEPSVYSNYFNNDSYLAGYSSVKQNSLSDEELVPIFVEQENGLKSTKQIAFTANNHDVLAGVSNLKSSPITKGHDLFNSWYGQDVKFILSSNSKLKSASSADTVAIEMYVPELVEILSPPIETAQELYPYCYYDNFILKWNADVNNENGLVVIVEWLGTVLSEDVDEATYVRNIDVINEDDGEVVLNSKLFDNIPNKALAYVTLLRGNIEIAELDSTSYRVFGESHAILPMVLVREINN